MITFLWGEFCGRVFVGGVLWKGFCGRYFGGRNFMEGFLWKELCGRTCGRICVEEISWEFFCGRTFVERFLRKDFSGMIFVEGFICRRELLELGLQLHRVPSELLEVPDSLQEVLPLRHRLSGMLPAKFQSLLHPSRS